MTDTTADLRLDRWLTATRDACADPSFTVLAAEADRRDEAVATVAGALPAQYMASERLDRILSRLGKPAAAKAVRQKLPTKSTARSGDLGEILAAHYINERTEYAMGIVRLRWSDHAEMAMRGEDMLAFNVETEPLRILKGESKSRVRLNTLTVRNARAGLDKDGGLPSPHALAFVADRLNEIGDSALADRIDALQLTERIRPRDVDHMLFTLSGNDPTAFLEADLNDYEGDNAQMSVGIRITDHGQFVADVFDRAADG